MNREREGFDWFEARCRNLLEAPAGFWLYNPLNQSIDWILKIIKLVNIWLFNIAMEHGPFIDGLPIKTSDFPWLC